MPPPPPQSKGDETSSLSFSDTLNVPPTLRPFLDNLPSATSAISDQRTPTSPPARWHSSFTTHLTHLCKQQLRNGMGFLSNTPLRQLLTVLAVMFSCPAMDKVGQACSGRWP